MATDGRWPGRRRGLLATVLLSACWWQARAREMKAVPEGLPVPPKTYRSVQAVPDSSLTTAGKETGCDHYRNGYLGIALCANYYDNIKDGKAYVQVIGSMTNEGIVDLCNLTLSIEHLDQAVYASPEWLPSYPRTSSFKAGTYFAFSAIIPVSANGSDASRYPNVDVHRSFYACDENLRRLPEDQVVPPPGTKLPTSGRTPSKAPANTFGSKIKWGEFIKAAGASKDCINPCVATLNAATEDCAAVAYVIQSGCASTCPPAVSSWAIEACKTAGCQGGQCRLATSPAASRGSKAFSCILLTAIYTALFAIKAFL